jgi:CP family cyanate transporter-like MFS transporter
MTSTVLLLWFCGGALRVSILAVPPVIAILRSELGMSATEIGVLSGLPVMMIAAAAIPGSLAIARFGARRTLIWGFALAGVFGGLRGLFADTAALLASTTLMSTGLAIAQPALPVLVRSWLPTRIGFGTAVYSNGMVAGCLLPMLLAPLVLALAPGNWRLILAGSACFIFLVACLVMFLGEASTEPANPADVPAVGRPLLDYGLLWRIGLIFGSNNSVYFGINAFLPLYFLQIGRAELIPAALAIYNFGQLPSSLLLMTIARRIERRTWPYVLSGVLLVFSILAICLIDNAWSLLAVALLGFASGLSLVLGLALPPLISSTSEVGRLSAGMFMISYAFAMAVSVVGGFTTDLTGSVRWALILIALSVVPLLLFPPTIRFDRAG